MNAYRYKAFISYKYDTSKEQVQKIDYAIRKYTTTWFKKSDIDFFIDERDASSLQPLGVEIIKGLNESEYLIYIATPEAANDSKFIAKELLYWFSHLGRKDKLLIILVDGLIEYDKSKGFNLDSVVIDWKRTNSIPKVLEKHLVYTRKHIDISNISISEYSIKNPKFRKEIIKITASLRGIMASELDDRISDLYKKNIRIRNFFILLLLLLSFSSTALFIRSSENESEAIKNFEEAKHQETLAKQSEEEAQRQAEKATKNEKKAFQYSKEATKQKDIALYNLKEVQRQKIFTEIAQEKTLLALKITETVNKEKLKIIDAFYFYDNKFALAYKNGAFGFIDKKGNIKIDYKYTEASQFNRNTGWAKVSNNFSKFYIDTSGHEYRLAENLRSLEDAKTNKIEFKALELTSGQINRIIPDIIFANSKLEILILKQMVHINKESIKRIEKLNNLTHLDLSNSLVYSELPKEIGKLSKLRYLNLPANNLKSIPPEIGKLNELEYLNLESSELETLPVEIGKLKKLKYLNLKGNNLVNLPVEISNLKELQYLNLEGNKLKSIPHEIKSLKKLKTLNLEGNNLTSIPKELGELSLLSELSLEKNNLNFIPKELGQLTNLQKLGLSHNKLKTIPDEIMTVFRKDTIIFLNDNQLIELPKVTSDLNKLKQLWLRNNNFTTFPKELCSLKNLEILRLSENNIDSIPDEINNLSNLRALVLNNRSKHYRLPPLFISKNIGTLANLEYLGLDNRTVELPKEIGGLKNLKSISLNGSIHGTLPSEMGYLKKLKYLDINNNYYLKLPKSIINLDIAYKKWDIAPLFQAASLFFNAGNYTKSIELYNLIIKKEGFNIHFTTELAKKKIGDCYSKLENYSQSHSHYQDAFKKIKSEFATNSSSSTSFYLAWFSLFANEPQEAINSSLKSLEENPDYTSIYSILAIGYVLNNEREKAKAIMLKSQNQFHPVMWKLYEYKLEKLLLNLEYANIKNQNINELRIFVAKLKHKK